MVAVNLYPWRQKRLDYEKRVVWQQMLVVLVAASLLLVVLHTQAVHKRDHWRHTVNALRDELRRYDAFLLKQKTDHAEPVLLNANVEKYRQIASFNKTVLHLLGVWQEDGACLTKVVQAQHEFVVSGYAIDRHALMLTLSRWSSSSPSLVAGIEYLRESKEDSVEFKLWLKEKTGEQA